MITAPWVPDLVIIAGPTAVGKTSVGIELAHLLGGEILSIDARQIYKGLQVGTAKPSPEECSRARHHLIDLFEPRERVTAAQFATHFRTKAQELWEQGIRPLVVGGSGLYLDACLGRLDAMPPADTALREQHAKIYAEKGMGALHDLLHERDPESAARIPPGDFKRISRALEVCELTGRPYSTLRRSSGPLDLSGGPPLFLLNRARDELYARIEERAQAMLDQGLLTEIERLRAAGLAADAPALESIGYPEFRGVLEGRLDLPSARTDFIRKTRRYAKRQLTWFRNRYRGVREVLIPEGERAVETAERIARELAAR